jgi:hypothetical protein
MTSEHEDMLTSRTEKAMVSVPAPPDRPPLLPVEQALDLDPNVGP